MIPQHIKVILTQIGLRMGPEYRETIENYIQQLFNELQKEKRLNASLHQASAQRIPKDL